MFADALEPPFAPGTLDTVLTPWFIDAVNADLRQTLTAINRALRLGGTWLNVGPLRFDGALSSSYVMEDVREIAGAVRVLVVAELRRQRAVLELAG